MSNNQNKELELLKRMFVMQGDFNSQVRPNWKSENLNWNLAILIESAEAAESLPWKWWKTMDTDLNNLKMEFVDLWHFIMAYSLSEKIPEPYEIAFSGYEESIKYTNLKGLTLSDEYDSSTSKDNLIYEIERIAYFSSKIKFNDGEKNTNFKLLFMSLFNALFIVGIDINDLFERYIGKNILNEFRQRHGYNSPDISYNKDQWVSDDWDGSKEDNDVLKIITDTLPENTENIKAYIIERLEHYYKV